MRHALVFASLLSVISGCPESSSTDTGVDGGGRDTPPLEDAGMLDVAADGGGLDGGGTDGGGMDAGRADAGGALGDCDSDTDCPPGGTCVELVPGGYRVCRVTIPEATMCEAGAPDECCNSAGCTAPERCYRGPLRPTCGGPITRDFNICAGNECENTPDCLGMGSICAPAGTFGPVNMCVSGSCARDGDCRAAADGHCVVFTDPCCPRPTGLFCTYGSFGGTTACRRSSDCATGYCGLGPDGVARCRDDGGPFCPL